MQLNSWLRALSLSMVAHTALAASSHLDLFEDVSHTAPLQRRATDPKEILPLLGGIGFLATAVGITALGIRQSEWYDSERHKCEREGRRMRTFCERMLLDRVHRILEWSRERRMLQARRRDRSSSRELEMPLVDKKKQQAHLHRFDRAEQWPLQTVSLDKHFPGFLDGRGEPMDQKNGDLPKIPTTLRTPRMFTNGRDVEAHKSMLLSLKPGSSRQHSQTTPGEGSWERGQPSILAGKGAHMPSSSLTPMSSSRDRSSSSGKRSSQTPSLSLDHATTTQQAKSGRLTQTQSSQETAVLPLTPIASLKEQGTSRRQAIDEQTTFQTQSLQREGRDGRANPLSRSRSSSGSSLSIPSRRRESLVGSGDISGHDNPLFRGSRSSSIRSDKSPGAPTRSDTAGTSRASAAASDEQSAVDAESSSHDSIANSIQPIKTYPLRQ